MSLVFFPVSNFRYATRNQRFQSLTQLLCKCVMIAGFLLFYFVPKSFGADESACQHVQRPYTAGFDFAEKYRDDVSHFAPGKKWDRMGYEREAARLTPGLGDPLVSEEFINRYREATGVNVQVKLWLELPQYLAALGIDPGSLVFLGSGVQGALFSHPKLGQQVIKVTTDALANSSICRGDNDANLVQLGPGHHSTRSLVRLRESFVHYVEHRNTYPSNVLPVVDQLIADIKRFYLKQAKQSLHRAQQIMLPELIASQAQVNYFGFARVTFIGNGFFIREYYPDSVVGRSLHAAGNLLASDKKSINDLTLELRHIAERQPVIAEIISSLVNNVPSYFVSPTLYRETRGARLIIIYDLD